jgi:uncharacterized membrane protein
MRASRIPKRSRSTDPRVVLGVGLVVTALYVFALILLMGITTYDTWGALIVGPILVLVSLPILSKQAAREGDRRVFWILIVALVLKLLSALARHYVSASVYGEGALDADQYHNTGVNLSENFRQGNFRTPGLDTLGSTDFMKVATGVLYVLIGPTKLGGFLVFSWLGFWGLYMFYRAFSIAVPEGRLRSYGMLVFFLPSLLYWPSSIGKESWMMFSLGLVAFGAARLFTGNVVRGLLAAFVGTWLAGVVRPHVAGLVALGIAAAYVFQKPREKELRLAPVARVVGVVLLAVFAFLLIGRAQRFLNEQGVETQQGLQAALSEVTTRTSQGGSSFAPSIVNSPARFPFAFVSVLFRPYLFEVDSATALLAALESTFLIGLAIYRYKWFFTALRKIRRRPYVGFAAAYVFLFILAFSSIANFGILARERVQALPFFLVLLCIPPRLHREQPGDSAGGRERAIAAPEPAALGRGG